MASSSSGKKGGKKAKQAKDELAKDFPSKAPPVPQWQSSMSDVFWNKALKRWTTHDQGGSLVHCRLLKHHLPQGLAAPNMCCVSRIAAFLFQLINRLREQKSTQPRWQRRIGPARSSSKILKVRPLHS